MYWGSARGRLKKQVSQYLPETWEVELRNVDDRPEVDAFLVVRGPDGTSSTIAVEFKSSLTPKAAEEAWRALMSLDEPSLLVAPHVSARTQSYLRERGMFYLDFAGNAWWRLDSPALTLSTVSDAKPPKGEPRRRRLRGAKAGRLIRYLCDRRPPFSVAELSLQLDIDRGNVSRYLGMLRGEGLITRGTRGTVTDVDWEGVLRRWAEDYRRPPRERYLDPRGRDHFLSALRRRGKEYVLSGVLGASLYSPYTIDIATFCYCDDLATFATSMGLLQEERGANVVLAMPFDDVVYSRSQRRDALYVAAPAQIAVDLLSGQGREILQGDEVIRWMKEHERDWRN
jgi:DNA-binding transcriptional ArsR family regulator